MPYKPRHPCGSSGCPELVVPGERYCTAHKQEMQKQYNRKRGSATRQGYDSRWNRYRIRFLSEHPLCEQCLKNGETRPATVVDHVVAHKGNEGLFWDPTNHQALCKRCHGTKTATQDGRWGGGGRKSLQQRPKRAGGQLYAENR